MNTNKPQSAAEKLCQTLVSSLPAAILVCDLQGVHQFVNQQAADMTGYSVDELMTGIWMIHPEDTQAVELFERALRDGTPGRNYETRLTRKDGSVLWASVSWNPIFDENGERAGLCTVFVDITEKKHAEEALNAVNERYRVMAENSADTFWEMDLDGTFTYVSPTVRRIGYEPEEWIGHSLMEFLAPDEIPLFAQRLENDLNDPHPVLHEVRVAGRDGAEVWVEVMVNFVVLDGKPVKMLGVARNITARKRAQEELQRVNERYRLMAENASDLLWSLDLDGTITYVSQAVRQLGYEPEDWIGHNASEFMMPEEHAAFGERMSAETLRNFRPAAHELHMHHKDGGDAWLEVVRNIVKENGVPVGVQGIARNITDRKRAEAELERVNERYRRMAEGSADVFWEMGPDDVFTYVSPAIRRFGFDPEEWVGHGFAEFLTPDQLPRFAEAMERVRLDTLPALYEYRVLARDGSEIWMEVMVNHIVADGKSVGRHGIARDITARKRAEEELQRANERYRVMAENSADMFWEMELDGTFTYASPAVRNLGYEPEDWVGHNIRELLAPEDIPAADERLEAGLRNPQPLLYEVHIRRKDGSSVWVEVMRNYVISDGKPLRMHGVARNVTARRATEEALRDSEQRYKSIVENTSDLIMLCRTDGVWTYASPACRDVIGYDPEEVIGTFPPLTIPEDSERVFPIFERAMTGESGSNLEYRIRTKNGEIKWVSHAWSPIFVGERLQAVLSVIRDVTESKQSEEALREAHVELEKAYTLQRQFLNSVTHEVRTPLTAVKGYVEMLMEGIAGPVSEEQAELLKKVLTSSQHLLDMVSGVLQIARMKSGRIVLYPTVCNPMQTIEKCISLVMPQAEKKGLAINVRSLSKNCLGTYDQEKLTIILTNLLTNAVKFTEAGSIDVILSCTTSGAEIIVADTGMGMRNSDIAGIFDEFSQLEFPGKHKPSGFGIGLAIVKAMVDAIGASLVVSTKKGVGTAFTLCIPALQA